MVEWVSMIKRAAVLVLLLVCSPACGWFINGADPILPAATLIPTLFIAPQGSSSQRISPAPPEKPAPTETLWTGPEQPPPVTGRMSAIPGYMQNDPAFGGLPGAEEDDPGSMYCAPAAVSNSLMWLDDNNGFDDIVKEDSENRKFDQFRLILELSKPDYLNTNEKLGTSHANILEGLERFLNERGYQYEALAHQGWMPVPEEYDQGDLVSLDWMKEGLRGCGSVWFSAGFYEYFPDFDIYRLKRSHMVTLVGFSPEGRGEYSNALIVHDPLQGDGSEPENLYIQAERIDSGVIEGSALGLPRPAEGYYRLEGLSIGDAEIAILNSAIVLKMPGDCPD